MITEFPTPVGMNLQLGDAKNVADRVPHARGDEPLNHPDGDGYEKSSPRPWG